MIRLGSMSASTIAFLFLGFLFARDSSAQSYWEDYNQSYDGDEDDFPKWNLAFRIGPYSPNVDNEFEDRGDTSRPFETTFGTGSSLYVGVDVERYLHINHYWQIGVSFTGGHVSNTAQAFASNGGVAETNNRTEDDTTFRLIPLSISGVFRLTALDELWNIPLVPYAKLGLSYYIWRFEDANGVSEAEGRDGNGATQGYQASLGIAIRAEKLDGSSARSLRNELGIHHAGFFIEYLTAQVNGFGSDTKLNVGDDTFVAGLNFEF